MTLATLSNTLFAFSVTIKLPLLNSNLSAIEIKTTPFSTLISISGSSIPTDFFKLETIARVTLSFLEIASCNRLIFESLSFKL